MTTIGKFITIEGIDGSGKTTLANSLCQWMRSELRVATLSGAEPYGYEMMRPDELQQRTSHLALACLDRQSASERQAAFLLFMANRALMNIDGIRAQGQTIVLDRYIDSTIAYHGDVDPRGDFTRILHNTFFWPTPDITLLLLCDVKLATTRIKQRNPQQYFDEERTTHLLANAQMRFITQAHQNAGRIYTIDASQGFEGVLETAKKELRRRFNWKVPQYAQMSQSPQKWKKPKPTG